MTALANITLSDALATPVVHTFSPTRNTSDKGLAKYYDRAGGVPVLYPEIHIAMYEPIQITARMKSADIDKLAFKGVMKILVPVADISAPASGTGIQPAPSQAYSCTSVTTFTLPVRSSLQARKDLLTYHTQLVAKPEIVNLVTNTEGIF